MVTPLSDLAVAAFSRSIVNLESGFKERVLYIDGNGTAPPTCKSSVAGLNAFLVDVAACVGPCTPVSVASYVASKKGSKRTVYMRAADNLIHRPSGIREMSSLSFFVKREATQFAKVQVPRVISPRTAEFNILLGRYLWPVEHRIFAALQGACGSASPVVAKGMTQQQKAATIVQKLGVYGCCVGLDASRFDQSIGAKLLGVEHQLYTSLFPNDRHLQWLLSEQLVVRGIGRCPDGIARFRGPAMRCSGDVNTSLGNCIISVALAWLYLKEHGINGDILCDGDDCLLFISPASLPLLQGLSAWYLGYGLRMKVEEPAYEPERVEFCQSRPVFDGSQWVLVRNPSKAFNTDGFVPFTLSSTAASEHIRAVGLCGLSMAAGMPLFDCFYRRLVDAGKTGRFDTALLGGLAYQHALQVRAGYYAVSRPVSPECRMSFWKAFGISPDEQCVMESQLPGWDPCRRLSVVDPQLHFLGFYPNRTPSDLRGTKF